MRSCHLSWANAGSARDNKRAAEIEGAIRVRGCDAWALCFNF